MPEWVIIGASKGNESWNIVELQSVDNHAKPSEDVNR